LLVRCCYVIFLSFIFNNSSFFIFFSQAPDENEMLEFMENSNTQENDNANQSELTTSDDTITDRQQVK
jgi:hypothetical protein